MLGITRSGLFCIADKPIRFRTLLPDGRLDQQEIVAQALQAAGLRYFRSATQAEGRGFPRYRVHGTIRAVLFDMCDRRGVSRAPFYSGTARVEMLWRVQGYDGAKDDFRLSTDVKLTVERSTPAPLGAIYRELLSQSARQLAERIKRGKPAEARP